MGPPYGQSDPPGHRIFDRGPAVRDRALARLRDDPALRRLAIPDPRVAGLPLPEPPRRRRGDPAASRNDPRYWTLRRRLRRAWRAFRDYPGQRVRDGGVWGRLVVCGEPYGCGGSGVLHEPDR